MAKTPVEPNLKLHPVKPEEVVNRDKFQRLIVSQFMHSPGQEHFDVV